MRLSRTRMKKPPSSPSASAVPGANHWPSNRPVPESYSRGNQFSVGTGGRSGSSVVMLIWTVTSVLGATDTRNSRVCPPTISTSKVPSPTGSASGASDVRVYPPPVNDGVSPAGGSASSVGFGPLTLFMSNSPVDSPPGSVPLTVSVSSFSSGNPAGASVGP